MSVESYNLGRRYAMIKLGAWDESAMSRVRSKWGQLRTEAASKTTSGALQPGQTYQAMSGGRPLAPPVAGQPEQHLTIPKPQAHASTTTQSLSVHGPDQEAVQARIMPGGRRASPHLINSLSKAVPDFDGPTRTLALVPSADGSNLQPASPRAGYMATHRQAARGQVGPSYTNSFVAPSSRSGSMIPNLHLRENLNALKEQTVDGMSGFLSPLHMGFAASERARQNNGGLLDQGLQFVGGVNAEALDRLTENFSGNAGKVKGGLDWFGKDYYPEHTAARAAQQQKYEAARRAEADKNWRRITGAARRFGNAITPNWSNDTAPLQ